MDMTHYMELLATNQPWNLLFFMAIPIIFAETLAITELYRLFYKKEIPRLEQVNRFSGIILGIYFIGIFVYLLINAVIPITTSLSWRGPIDIIAVGAYLSGVIPLAGIAFQSLGLLGRHKTVEEKLKLHVTFIAIFLIVAHIAMIFGMTSPGLLSPGLSPGSNMTGMP